ncbi:DUF2935 domain-containing protein [Heliobacillus mobilis]|uniref:DUF2935 domain-containing protein n=1 Tax=Heliobacterium mobile TaxID=28064 RepID=A0A6I3SGA0_HELMO|nr:DUF2935 domain-containing protein [Heliobacterium mobile]MTV47421.1 DUF2935 domain-containing protein [Heliobacterium mobile]
METVSFEQSALFEHRFWLQILGDHSRFIFNALSPKEAAEIQRAEFFIIEFDRLLEEARRAGPETDLMALGQQAYNQARELRNFKLHLLRRHIIDKIDLNLPPTMLNHMVNEVEEYLRILCFLLAKQCPTVQVSHLHLLWLSDASGHAAFLASGLDEVEKPLIDTNLIFERQFDNLYKKAVNLAGYMRAGVKEFPALQYLNRQVEREINSFSAFLTQLEASRKTKAVLGIFPPLTPDHMIREECYYLIKLAQVSTIKPPECDPTQPRSE